jgi:hypothetical protein
MLAGWEIRVSTPPRLSAREDSAGIGQSGYIEGDHSAEAGLLMARDFVLGMVGQAWIVDALHAGVTFEEARERDAVGIMLSHAHGQCLDSAGNQEAIHRREAGTGGALHEIDALGIVRLRKNCGAAKGVAVAVQIFGHGMDNDARAELDGLLEVRSEERVVDDEDGFVRVGDARDGGDVSDFHRGIRGRLDVDHARVGLGGPLDGLGRTSVNKTEFEAELNEELSGQAEDATVDGFGDDGVIAGAQETEDGVNRGHAGSEDVGLRAAFEARHGALERLAIGMLGARVVEAFVFAEGGLHVRGSLVDGRNDGAGGWIRLLSDVDGIGGETHGSSLKFRRRDFARAKG